jgi:CheY-like chemotaxis protein
VVVSDFAMPGMEGTTFFEHLKEQYPALALRVVFVTGYGNDEKTKKLLEHTGRPYLAKPVDLRDFLTVVMRTAQRPGQK